MSQHNITTIRTKYYVKKKFNNGYNCDVINANVNKICNALNHFSNPIIK